MPESCGVHPLPSLKIGLKSELLAICHSTEPRSEHHSSTRNRRVMLDQVGMMWQIRMDGLVDPLRTEGSTVLKLTVIVAETLAI
jgi:hypothetical protein